MLRTDSSPFLTGGDGDTRTGRLCPRCGSSRHGRPFLRRTDVPAAGGQHLAHHRDDARRGLLDRCGRCRRGAGRPVHGPGRSPTCCCTRTNVRASAAGLATTWVRKEALLKASGDGLVGRPAHGAASAADATAAGRRRVAARACRGPGWVVDLALADGLVAAAGGGGDARPDGRQRAAGRSGSASRLSHASNRPARSRPGGELGELDERAGVDGPVRVLRRSSRAAGRRTRRRPTVSRSACRSQRAALVDAVVEHQLRPGVGEQEVLVEVAEPRVVLLARARGRSDRRTPRTRSTRRSRRSPRAARCPATDRA